MAGLSNIMLNPPKLILSTRNTHLFVMNSKTIISNRSKGTNIYMIIDIELKLLHKILKKGLAMFLISNAPEGTSTITKTVPKTNM